MARPESVTRALTMALAAILGAPGNAPGQARADDELLSTARGVLDQQINDPRIFGRTGPAVRGLALRAAKRLGMPLADPRLKPAADGFFKLDLSSDPQALIQRIQLRLEPTKLETDDALRQDVAQLIDLQSSGYWGQDESTRTDLNDRVCTTAEALEAIVQANRYIRNLPTSVFSSAGDWLLASQRRDGGYGHSRKKRAHGWATVSATSSLYLLAARKGIDPGRRAALLAAADKAESWLAKHFRPDRNPGASLGKHEFIAALDPFLERTWCLRLGNHDVEARITKELINNQLQAGGWNDSVLSSGNTPQPMRRGGRTGGAISSINAAAPDLVDTALAALYLAPALKLTPPELALAIERRVSTLGKQRTIPDAALEAFVEKAARAGVYAIRPLLHALRSDQRLSRRAAIEALRELSRGSTFGYDPRRSKARNQKAIDAWIEWGKSKGVHLER